MRGRRYALTEDITDLVHDVLRHRLVLSYEALAEGVAADGLIDSILARVPGPESVAESEAAAAAAQPAAAPTPAAPGAAQEG
jgi:MoxR-like ATPase